MSQKPSIPKGTRDFLPHEVIKRNFIINHIQKAFKNFGYEPIETPAFENLSTLIGKYGEEGDRLIYKILNSGAYLSKIDDQTLLSKNYSQLNQLICDRALRYDLTVPFARYVVQHQNEITFPFKRYQIQPVWRADRPQRGRFREFYQCDADVVGSNSLWQEIEFIQLYDRVFKSLQLTNTTIKINNRKILAGIAEIIGESDKLIPFTVALDKLDKIGIEAVKNEMLSKGINEEALHKISPLFNLEGSNLNKLNQLKTLLKNSSIGMKGIEELEFITQTLELFKLEATQLLLDVTLARGLDYYTGAIFEVSAPKEVQIGSIGGGGRYDDLTSVFGLKGISGVGISFGLDRIYLTLESLNLFKEIEETKLSVLFLNYGNDEVLYALKAITALRNQNITTELYPDASKVKKQMQYAHKKGFKYVVHTGEKEMKNKTYTLKEMETGIQNELDLENICSFLLNTKH